VAKKLKKIPAFFYQSESGNEPVREWLKALDDDDRRIVGEDIATVEFGWPIGMLLCKPLGSGLHEVRSSIASNREARVIFTVRDERMILLHGFIKKSQKASKSDLDLAKKRLKDTAD